MNAAEARELAKQRALIEDVKHREICVRVIDHIKGVLDKEECYATTWYGDLPDPVIKMLEEDGYRVISNQYRNETQYTISWAE